MLDDYCFCQCCQLLNSKKGYFFALSMAHVFQTILSVDVKEKAIAALISTLKMVHSAPLLIIDATGTSNRLPSRERVKAYLKGLLSSIERKNGWQLAEEAGYSTPYAIQYLLDRAVWESDQVRDELQAYVYEMIGKANGVYVLDETGFLKKGKKSVGVQRQYSGTAGRVENCQIGVFLAYATEMGHTLVDRELYLPKSWTQDLKRCREADVPEKVTFATKPQLAARMLWRALEAGRLAKWVTGDCVSGSNRPLRAGLESRQQGYALCVKCSEKVQGQGQTKRVDRIAEGLGAEKFHRLSAGNGSKGPRLFDWACIELDKPEQEGWQRFLVVRRSLVEDEKPAELAYVLVFAPCGTTLEEMVAAIGMRWSVEQCFEESKAEVGLDEYEVRSWHGWYRHITLSMLAHAFLLGLRILSQTPVLPNEESSEKKRWRPSQPHSPSTTLSAFKRLRGLACP
jgi:SRSO17 transposase